MLWPLALCQSRPQHANLPENSIEIPVQNPDSLKEEPRKVEKKSDKKLRKYQRVDKKNHGALTCLILSFSLFVFCSSSASSARFHSPVKVGKERFLTENWQQQQQQSMFSLRGKY